MLQRFKARENRYGSSGLHGTRRQQYGHIKSAEGPGGSAEFLGNLVPALHRGDAVTGANAEDDEAARSHGISGQR